MKRAIFLVGHSNWGKSATLKYLLGNGNAIGSRQAWLKIKGIDLFIRRMSNDDNAGLLKKFASKVDENEKENIIVAFCPDFDDPDKHSSEILNIFSSKYDQLYFFVLESNWDGSDQVALSEINILRQYGNVKIESNTDYKIRAREFRKYISQILP